MIEINLLPQTRKKYIDFFYLPIPIFLIVAGIILLSWHVVLRQKINTTVKYSNSLQQELNILRTHANNHVPLTKQQQMVQQLKSHLINLEQKRLVFTQIFEALHQGMAGNLYLIQLLIKNLEIKITGQTKSTLDLIELITKLTTVRYGSNMPAIQKLTRQDDGYNFILSWSYGKR